ncbi:MAG: adenine phosphoribosyltransferase [Acidimicrobiia bacterium]|nr:adenine phosphoribosyltransferase [Acidimicrobiia bacterium]NND13567.1 adenine phosphoribosyltransferase [Acidimicrobiia bacterium]NNL27735.1 adenine phosphoribosyltransferase [Acidimicrobiia bacterium]
MAMDLASFIRDIPDFPEPGIMFKDITPLLGSPSAFDYALDQMMMPYEGIDVDYVAGIESRGFILAAPLAVRMDAGHVPIRKPGKLPSKVERIEYALEYGTDALEVHVDAVQPGSTVVIADDVMATGGTAAAAVELMNRLGAHVVGLSVLIELSFLEGRSKLSGVEIHSLITY